MTGGGFCLPARLCLPPVSGAPVVEWGCWAGGALHGIAPVAGRGKRVMKLNSGTITAGVAVLAIVIALAGMVYQQGRLVNRVDALSQKVDALSADMDQLMGQVGELKVQVDLNTAAIARLETAVQQLEVAVQQNSAAIQHNTTRIDLLFELVRELPTRAEVSILISEAITRNSRLLLEALDGHTHTDDGVVFSIPPGIERLGVAPSPSPTPGAAQ